MSTETLAALITVGILLLLLLWVPVLESVRRAWCAIQLRRALPSFRGEQATDLSS